MFPGAPTDPPATGHEPLDGEWDRPKRRTSSTSIWITLAVIVVMVAAVIWLLSFMPEG